MENRGKEEAVRALKVAWSTLKDVEDKMNALEEANRPIDTDSGFAAHWKAGALKGAIQSEMNANLDLAWKQADTAEQIDPGAYAEVPEGGATVKGIRALVLVQKGDMQFAMEKWDKAIEFYKQSLGHEVMAHTYYDLGAAYINKHDKEEALKALQKVVELDGTGGLAVEATKAIEKLKAGQLGSKAFSGSWKVFAVLAGLSILSLFMMSSSKDTTGLGSFAFWGVLAALYWRWKYK